MDQTFEVGVTDKLQDRGRVANMVLGDRRYVETDRISRRADVVFYPDCGGEITSVVVGSPALADTEQLRERGIDVIMVPVENPYIRNAFRFVYDRDGKEMFCTSKWAERTGTDRRATGETMNQVGGNMACIVEQVDFGQILITEDNKPVVQYDQARKLLGMGWKEPIDTARIELARNKLASLGMAGTVFVGDPLTASPDLAYDLDLFMAANIGGVVLSEVEYGSGISDVSRGRAGEYVNLCNEQISRVAKVQGKVPLLLDEINGDPVVYSYANVLIDSRYVFVPQYKGKEEENMRAMNAWREICSINRQTAVGVDLSEKAARFGNAGLRCLSVESRRMKVSG